jgi:NADPH:quinone reductase-like Zn-dependent oxidoreductase
MKLRYKISFGILAFFTLAFSALALVLSHNSDCGPMPEIPAGSERMKAVVYQCYGSPDEVVQYTEVSKPVPAEGEMLVRVKAAAVNPLDWHYIRGTPYFMRLFSGLGTPDDPKLGVDFSGVVEAVGKGVERFKPGDEVFGARSGAFAEYVMIPADKAVVKKPRNVTFEQAAAVPIAAVTALQALRDKGRVKKGDKVLINGASGGVGTFAVQIAKSAGAEVTGVCSTRNVERVRAIGADHVIDYTNANYTETGKKYDVIVDMVGNHSLAANREALKEDGRLVIVGGKDGDWLGPMLRPLQAKFVSAFVDQELNTLLAVLKVEDLEILAELMQSGQLVPVLDRYYPMSDIREAIGYSESGRARGKIIITP